MSKKRHSFLSTQFITAAISTTLVLVLLGIIVLFVITAQNLSTYVKENINVSVLISDEMDSLQIKSMEKMLKQAPYAKSVEYISKEQALVEEIQAQGIDPTEFIGVNPYTASFEVKIHADHANPDSISSAVKKLKGNPNVVDVIYSKDLIKSVNDNIRKVSIILLIIAALFTYISFALINNTVRLTIFSKRFIINTMKLVGASWNFIRRPFLTQSFTLGIASAIIADALIIGGIYWLHNFEPQITAVIDLKAIIIVSAAVFLFGIIITYFCTLFSLNKYLKMSSNELYYI
ncbi:MAG: permease-like cell division protein FtsX [Bacteroidaceae bacterium]|jgi:cell division transport system permease protein|nr:permease-like cell division protein FtsX [Bacteroidaceae bacterium]MBR1493268.1 permease-like cell division protein FtsX [Bacteroidaceae bacterium]MDY6257561.1 permease-like cell division protein FtsX [Bacteroidaceae bacterium]